MQSVPGDVPDEVIEQVSILLGQVLAMPAEAQPDLLAKLCTQHGDCAAALRQGFAALLQFDLARVGEESAATPATPGETNLPRTFGSFRLLEFLGAGGMGSVYRAEDLELKRPVALKLIRSEMLASERTRSRFHREAAALARLDHPGLCTVYRAGSTDGQPWIAMRLVKGSTLEQQIERRIRPSSGHGGSAGRSRSLVREDLSEVLQLFEKVARALAAAHASGVIHRDIKPGNIVLTDTGEPVVIDFGLVHLADSDTHLTASGDPVGTPAYMAPEQIAPAGREPGPATDCYALAVTLFEVLTLRSPYELQSRDALFRQIVRGERLRLEKACRGLPRDLGLVMERALDVEPARRYPSMVEFADDLRRVRLHEPPTARRIGVAIRLRRWCRRNPVAATFLTVLGVGLAATLALNASRQAAWRHALAMAYGNLAGELLDENAEHALDVALLAVELEPGDPEALGHLLRALQEVHPHTTWQLPWPKTPRTYVQSLVVSPRGDAALVLGDREDQSSAPPVLWQRHGVRMLPIDYGAWAAAWSPDGSEFVTAGPDGPPQIWSVAGELLATVQVPDAPPGLRVPSARFLPGGRQIVFACSDGIARIHDRDRDTWTGLAPRLAERRPGMPGLAISADGARIALGDRDGRVVVHEVADALEGKPGRWLTPESPRSQEQPGDPAVIGLDLGARGELVQVRKMHPERTAVWTWSGTRLQEWGSRDAPSTTVPLDPFGERALEIAQDREPRLWRLDGDRLRLERPLAGHDGKVAAAGFSAEGDVVTVGVDGTARVWSGRTGRQQTQLRGFPDEPRQGAFLGSSSACLLATTEALHHFDLRAANVANLEVGEFRDAHVVPLGPPWGAAILTADSIRRLALHGAAGHLLAEVREDTFVRRGGLALAADRRWLVSTSYSRSRQNEARIYAPDLEPLQRLSLPLLEPHPFVGPGDQLLFVDLGAGSSSGDCVLYEPGALRTWTAAFDAVSKQFSAACSGASAAAFHAGTATLALAKPGAAVTLHRWSTSPPELVLTHTLLPGESRAHKIAFSPDGTRLLLACEDRVVRLVDRTGRIEARVTGHVGSIQDLDVSPSGDRFLIAATESGVTIHDRSGRLLLPIRPRRGAVQAAKFLPDGERIVLSTTARTSRIVPVEPGRLVALARAVAKPETPAAHMRSYRARVGDD